MGHEMDGTEHRLSHVVDALPGLVWTALPNGDADFVNQRWCEYTGLTAEEACGRGWMATIHQDDLPALVEDWRDILASGEPRELEARLRRFDGAYRWFAFRASPVRDESGRVVGWCGINTDIEDRKRAESTLRERVSHFRTIADCIPALIAIMSPSGEVENVNRHVLDYFGLTLDDLKSWALSDVVHPDDLPGVIAAWTKSVQSRELYDIEHRMRRVDGVYRWFHVRGVPLQDANGVITRWYVLQTDIDARKQAEGLLAAEKQLLEAVSGGRKMSEVLEMLCRMVEAATSECYCSAVLLDPTGTHLEATVAPNLPAIFSEWFDGRPVSVDSDPCTMAARLNEQVVSADLATDARWRSQAFADLAREHGIRACWSIPFSSSTGSVLGVFSLYFEVPGIPVSPTPRLLDRFINLMSIAVERVQGDAALRTSEALLTQAQQLSSTASFHWRAATGELSWSAEAYRLFQFDRQQPITSDLIISRIHPDDAGPLADVIARTRHGELAELSYELRLVMPDRSIKHARLALHGIRNDDQSIEYIAAVQDITERRLAEETLDRVRSELAHVARVTSLGTLTASIAHEVSQPLTAIVTNADTCLRLLAADPPNVARASEAARRMIRDGHRASEVITRLRQLFAKKPSLVESVDLNEAVREVVALTMREMHRSRVTVRAELAEGLPLVTGDRVQLQQVILNLLLNAAEAMHDVDDRPRELLIRTSQDDALRVSVVVRDSGFGFEPEISEKIFEPFYTTKDSGMGIGLSVSREIINSHRGHLWAAPNDGPGATFAISLPSRAVGT